VTSLYFSLAAIHIYAIVLTGVLWLIIDFKPQSKLHRHLKIIRGVHFGSLFVVPMILGLAFAFEQLQVPAWHRAFFPVGMELLFIVGVGASLFPLTPRRASVGPDYPWTRTVARVFGKIALAGLVIGFTWTSVVLFVYAAVR
jgi:hypothetical protein